MICFKITLDEKSRIGRTVIKAESTCREIDKCLNKSEVLNKQIDAYLKRTNGIRKSVKEHFDKLTTLQSTLQYLKVVRHVEDLRLVKRSLISFKVIIISIF